MTVYLRIDTLNMQTCMTACYNVNNLEYTYIGLYLFVKMT